MASQSIPVDPKVSEEAAEEAVEEVGNEEVMGEEKEPEDVTQDSPASSVKAKKKKSKKAKMKKLLGARDSSVDAGPSSNPASKLTPGMVDQLLEMNPSLKGEIAGLDKDKAVDKLKELDVADLLTGMSISGKNQKDMASYKFWKTQPVPRFDEAQPTEEGPINDIDPEKVPNEPRTLYEGFEWVTMDLTDQKELAETFDLLTNHYVEDNDAMFRLNYSASVLNWALKSPGWRKDWHVGVRAAKSGKLVAFISAIPVNLRVRSKVLNSSEVNFLCIHKKLRSKRLAPVLIEEITRRCYKVGVFQAIYTSGTIVPKPVSSCRYYHRPLDWMKLFEVGFCGLPTHSTKSRQVTKHFLPNSTTTPGFRPMQQKDVPAVQILLKRYLKRFAMAPEFDEEEVKHWLLHDENISPEQVIWTYVVEDPSTHKVTDFTSFFCLESAIIGGKKYGQIRAAYMFYYASEAAFENEGKGLKERLNNLILDTLIIAKSFGFDTFNALTLLDNPLFLEQQKFGRGDGLLHYYLYNYRTALIPGGVDAQSSADERKMGGVGVVML